METEKAKKESRCSPLTSNDLLGAALIICASVLNDFKSGIAYNSENAIRLIEFYAKDDERLSSLSIFILADVIKPEST